MAVVELLRVLLRRWYLVVPGIALSVGCAIGVWQKIVPTYQVRANVLILPAASSSGPTNGPGNPYLALGAGEDATLSVIAVAVEDPAASAALAARGVTSTYAVSGAPGVNAPVLEVSVRNSSAAQAQHDITAVVAELKAELNDLQVKAGAPASSFITGVVLTSSRPTVVNKTRIRDALVAAVAVLVLSILFVLLVDKRFRARKQPVAVDDEALGGLSPDVNVPTAEESTFGLEHAGHLASVGEHDERRSD